MEWILWVLAVVVLGAGAVVASGGLGALPGPEHDAPVLDLPDGPLGAEELRAVQFRVDVRGYSMAQVDELLARLERQLSATTESYFRPVDAGGAPVEVTPQADGSAIMAADEFSQQSGEGEPWQQ
ncbi:DivIVA domain-containing protein [Propioniciclava soli]|uniref:DivIVA domain-containing protein n=1 Tax=Propioniciclava soli TaxID=2775081 RepID=UPI001E64A6C8|nr:DivIVA domain-containing protein [Propioniciclava soli]